MADQDPQQPDPNADPDAGTQLTDEIAQKYDPDRLLKMVSSRAGKGQNLDHDIRAKYEKRFGVDLGHVRILTGEFAEEFNRQRGAYAVTVGSTGMILMGNSPDRSMATRSGQALLAHELTHVAQQRRGLYNKSAVTNEFATEEEEEAEAVEHEVASGGDGSGQGAGGGESKQAKEEKKKEAVEKIVERVMDMLADAHRTNWMRNSVQRRP